MGQIERLVRDERDRLCVAYSYAYVEAAAAASRRRTSGTESLVIQPYKKVFFPSAARAAALYARLQGAAIPILFSPQRYTEEQYITHIGRLTSIGSAKDAVVADDVRLGVKSKRYLLQSDEEPVYSKGSFLLVLPNIVQLPNPVPLNALQNALGPRRGTPTEALSTPAPKLVTPEYRYILDYAPGVDDPTEGRATVTGNEAPCGKCRRIVPRDDLRGLNPRWWDADQVQTRIRIRLCGLCLGEVTTMLRGMEWDPSEERPRR